ncbi:MAG: hypothetical protein JWO94_401, partial [Verrucomicrobiaceae bacterium]|nr:hypothetical protein [Verrucomicrobiaceae bacterium]
GVTWMGSAHFGAPASWNAGSSLPLSDTQVAGFATLRAAFRLAVSLRSAAPDTAESRSEDWE